VVNGPDTSAFAAPEPALLPPGPRPSFSVVVAAWQVADLIGVALDSALQQTEPPHEVIVVDDGSTDDLVGALERFGQRIRLLQVPHGGLSTARNVSVGAATGDFIAILDADDRWEPQRLARLADLAQARPDLDLLTTDAWFLVDGERRGRFYEANTFATEDQATAILERNYFFAHLAVRRSTWHRFGGMAPDVAWAEDWDFWLRLLLAGCSAGCVMEPLADYRIHAGSVSANRWRSLQARVEVLDRAARAGGLTDHQRRVLEAARATYRRRAVMARAEQALLQQAPDRRSAALTMARTAGTPLRQRVAGLGAALLPNLAGARLRRASKARGQARTDRSIPRR